MRDGPELESVTRNGEKRKKSGAADQIGDVRIEREDALIDFALGW